MSGYFDYTQHKTEDIANKIDKIIERNGTSKSFHTYPPDIIEKFKEAAHTLRRAADMAQRVDWLVSGDDGEDSFRQRWLEEVRPPWDNKNMI